MVINSDAGPSSGIFSTENAPGGDAAAEDGIAGARSRQTKRYEVTGCSLEADKELAALFEASSLIHVDRNGLRQPIEKMGVSRLPPSCRHVVVCTWNNLATSRARKTPGFLFQLSLSDSYFVHLNRRRFPPCTRAILDCLEQSKNSVKRRRRIPGSTSQLKLAVPCWLTSSRNVLGQRSSIDLGQCVFRLHTF